MESPNISPQAVELNQSCSSKPIPTDLELVPDTKAWSLEAFLQYSVFHLWFVHLKALMPSLARLSKRFRVPGTNGRLDLSLTGEYLRTHLKDHTRYDRGQEIHGGPRRVSLPVGEAQLDACLRVQ